MSVKSPGEIDIAVGGRIRSLRLERGLSQTKIADRLGVTFQQQQKYEKGVNRISPGRLAKMAEILEVDIPTLLPTSHQVQPIDDVGRTMGTTRRGIRMARAFMRMSIPQQDALMALAEAIVDPQAEQKAA